MILSGAVDSWSQRAAAEEAASQAPVVTHVDNHISISPAPLAEEDGDEIC